MARPVFPPKLRAGRSYPLKILMTLDGHQISNMKTLYRIV